MPKKSNLPSVDADIAAPEQSPANEADQTATAVLEEPTEAAEPTPEPPAPSLLDVVNQHRAKITEDVQKDTAAIWQEFYDAILRHVFEQPADGDAELIAELSLELELSAVFVDNTVKECKRAVRLLEEHNELAASAEEMRTLRAEKKRLEKECEQRIHEAHRAHGVALHRHSRASMAASSLYRIRQTHPGLFGSSETELRTPRPKR